MALRASGAELKAIAEDQQVAISTAHQRVTTAVQRMRKQARRRRIGPDTLRPMLAALGESSFATGCVCVDLARVIATGRTRSGKAIGRPRRGMDLHAVTALRAQGRNRREIAQALLVPRRTLTKTWALEHNPGLDPAA